MEFNLGMLGKQPEQFDPGIPGATDDSDLDHP
jgi:hypothetical protein